MENVLVAVLVIAVFAFIALSVAAKAENRTIPGRPIPWFWAIPLLLAAGVLYYFTRLN